MNRLLFCLSLVWFLAPFTTSGQIVSQEREKLPYIEVTGIAEKEVIPDEIYIAFSIREKYENKLKVTIEEQEDKLKTALKSLGINLSDLYISDITSDYVRIYWKKKDVLTKKDYTLKVSDAATVGQVYLEFEKLEISSGHIAKVSHSKLDSLRRDVNIMAIKAAKTKADYLLAALGVQAGAPLVIVEKETLSPNSGYSANSRGARSDGYYFYDDFKGRNEDNEIQFLKIKIQSNIVVKFSIQ